MERREREALDRHLTTQPEEPEHPDCGCSLVDTDCCDEQRWECETTVVLDSNGDPDVRACKRGFGCDTEEAMWANFESEQHAAFDLADRLERYGRGEED
jgi:hypothetical protein